MQTGKFPDMSQFMKVGNLTFQKEDNKIPAHTKDWFYIRKRENNCP
jgi:hypothetical protein